jgi:hypothetical protein
VNQHRILIIAVVVVGALCAPMASADARAPRAPGSRVLFGRPGASRNLFDPVRTVARQTQAAPAPAPAAPAPQACTSDAQCPQGTICESGVCRAVERAINVLLFRKEGPATWVIPFYWNRRGSPGYRVVVPIYWHFWSSEERSRIVAPFYWHFEDYLKQRVVTVVVPYVHTRQPDAESWAVWPLFYASTKFGWAAPLLGSFKVEDPAQGRGLGLYAFLYFWKRAPGSALDIGFPLFVSKRSTEGAFTYALPLNFYWRTGKDRNLLILPLLYWNRSPASGLLVSPLGYKSSAEGGASRGSALWVYWWGRRSDSRYDVVFPLLWSFRSPQSNTTILPPVIHLRRGESRFTSVVPLWFSSSNGARGTAWQLFFPFYFSRTGEQGRSRLWLTPLGGYRRDDDEGSRALTFLIPPLIWRRDSQHEFSSYMLVYWRYRDLLGDSSTTLIGPYYRHDDASGSTRGLLLFWYFKDTPSGATAHTLFPLYFRRSAPGESTTAAGIFPVWGFYRGFSNGYSFGLSPLAFFGSRGERSHALVLPLFYHLKDGRSSATVLFPAFYRFTDAQHENTGVPPLLYFQGRDHQTSYKVQFPLFWRFRDDVRGTVTTAVPPVFYRSRRDGWSAGLAPLLFAGGGGPRGHFVLFPLFWHFRDDTQDSRTVVALNYLHRRRGGETTDALFPLLHYRRGARPGGSDQTSFTFFPLVHYRRDPSNTVLVTPLGGYGRGPQRRFGLVGPYFWYGSPGLTMRGLPPVFLDVSRPATGERNRIVGPWFQMDAPGRGARVLFPLAARYWDQHDSGTYVFPTFFHRRTTDGYVLNTLPPLFWLSSYPGGYSSTVLGPFFRTTAPDGGSLGLLPLFVHTRNAERRLLVTPLFVHHERIKEGTSSTYAPLVYRATRPEGSTAVVFPLWWSGREKERSHQVLFPLFWRFANQSEQSAWTLAGPLFWSHSASWRTRGLLPVAWYSRNGEGSGTNALLPLFYEKHSPTDRTVLTLPFGYRSAPDSNWFYFLLFIHKDGWDKSFWTLFPLAFSHYDKISETRTRLVPPLLAYQRTSPERSLTGFLLLFWRHRTITSTTTLGLPLFYDFNSFDESRLTMFLPLFVRYRNQVTDTSIAVAPLFYRRSSPTDSTTVAFPLVWDFRGGDRRSTVVFPFYAGFRRANWEGRYIFPNIWYRTGLGPEAGTSRLLIFPFWESAVKRPGDYLWEAFLGLFGWERIGRNRYLKLLFIPFELSPAPAAVTAAWHGKIPPPSRRQRARTLSTQAW